MIVDTSEDLMLVEKRIPGKNQRHVSGNIAITDRGKLAEFFKRLNKAQNHNLVVCNLLFDQDSPVDEALTSEMQRSKDLLVAQGRDSMVVRPIFKGLPSGLTEIYTSAGTVSKFRLFEKNENTILKSLPLLMAEHMLGDTTVPGNFVSHLGNQSIFNDFSLEEFVHADEVAHFTLGFLTDKDLSNERFMKMVQDKIIIIDNLDNNTKRTLYNSQTPTAIFLANTYLSIHNGRNGFSIPFLVTLCIVFAFFSYLVAQPQNRFQKSIFKLPLMGVFIGGAGYILSFIMISLVFYVVFHNNLNLIYMGMFFYLENLVINRRFHLRRIQKRLNIR